MNASQQQTDTPTTSPAEVPALDPETGEPTNETRTARVAAAIASTEAWSDANDVEFATGYQTPSVYTVGAILADIRHFCDEHKIDFHLANRIGQEHHEQEAK